MSQITIVDDVLNFTQLNASMQHAAERSDSSEERGAGDSRYSHDDMDGAAKSLNEEEQRVVHELTSILISGHLPQ